jgi:hypothetical protein
MHVTCKIYVNFRDALAAPFWGSLDEVFFDPYAKHQACGLTLARVRQRIESLICFRHFVIRPET